MLRAELKILPRQDYSITCLLGGCQIKSVYKSPVEYNTRYVLQVTLQILHVGNTRTIDFFGPVDIERHPHVR